MTVQSLPNGTRRPIPAVGIVCLKDESVLLIQRGRSPLKGHWSLPGGHIEFGEHALEAAKRELFEETEIVGQAFTFLDVVDSVFPQRGDQPPIHYIILEYGCLWQRGEAIAGDDAKRAQFVAVSELDNYALTHQTLRIIEAGILALQGK